MKPDWFSLEDRFVEVLVKQAIAQHLQGYLDPRDAGSKYDCTVLVPQAIEIKHDKKACQTGNLYFETRNTRQQAPSGLQSTQAQLWAVYLPATPPFIIAYDPKIMLAYLCTQLGLRTPGFRETLPSGGDNNSQGIVAPLATIERQPFVTRIPFKLELPTALPTMQGTVGRCVDCQRMVVIEHLQMGVCLTCRDALVPTFSGKGA